MSARSVRASDLALCLSVLLTTTLCLSTTAASEARAQWGEGARLSVLPAVPRVVLDDDLAEFLVKAEDVLGPAEPERLEGAPGDKFTRWIVQSYTPWALRWIGGTGALSERLPACASSGPHDADRCIVARVALAFVTETRATDEMRVLLATGLTTDAELLRRFLETTLERSVESYRIALDLYQDVSVDERGSPLVTEWRAVARMRAAELRRAIARHDAGES